MHSSHSCTDALAPSSKGFHFTSVVVDGLSSIGGLFGEVDGNRDLIFGRWTLVMASILTLLSQPDLSCFRSKTDVGGYYIVLYCTILTTSLCKVHDSIHLTWLLENVPVLEKAN